MSIFISSAREVLNELATVGFFLEVLRPEPADVHAALCCAAAAGALAVSKPGACERPITKEEVEAALEAGVVASA